MSTGLINIMKLASQHAMDNAQMCDLRFGTVVGVFPLRIQVTNQFTLPESLLIVPEHLTDYTVKCAFTLPPVTVGDVTTNEEPMDTDIIIQNALKVGDKVALLRKQGGQAYYVLDRI